MSIKKIKRILSWGAFIASYAYSHAALATLCPPASPPLSSTRFHADMTQYSESYRSASLKALMRHNKESTLATDTRTTVFGVTVGSLEDYFAVTFRTLTEKTQNTQCLYIEKIQLDLNYKPKVYVAADIRDLPCSYQVTRDHEQSHVAMDYKVLQNALPDLKRRIDQTLHNFPRNGFGPYPMQKSEFYQNQVVENIKQAIRPLIENMRTERRKQQATIDTADNYRKDAEKCPQEAEKIKIRFDGGRK